MHGPARMGMYSNVAGANDMKVFLTGHRGYIGSVMTPLLLEAGHNVIGCDSDLYQRCTFDAGGAMVDVPTISKDVRDLERSDLRGVDAVIHLAALSNDPLGNLNADVTYSINHRASVRLAKIAKEAALHDRFFKGIHALVENPGSRIRKGKKGLFIQGRNERGGFLPAIIL